MNLYKRALLIFLALSLIIRPVFAEGLMLHSAPNMQTDSLAHTSDHRQINRSQVMDVSLAMQHALHHPDKTVPMNMDMDMDMDCCEHQTGSCSDCSEGSCVVISAAPLIANAQSTTLIVNPISHIQAGAVVAVFKRAIPPELRPPSA